MKREKCNHNWIEDWDSKAEQDAYNDGVNYLPAEYICTHCKRRKKIKYRRDPVSWKKEIIVALGVLALFLYFAIAPFIMLVIALYETLFPKEKSSV